MKILNSNNKYSLLELKPITGRKHQLRKQLYNIGNPVVGDDKYFIKLEKNKLKSKNLLLHAYKIKFMINNVKYNFEAKYNDHFSNFIKKKYQILNRFFKKIFFRFLLILDDFFPSFLNEVIFSLSKPHGIIFL